MLPEGDFCPKYFPHVLGRSPGENIFRLTTKICSFGIWADKNCTSGDALSACDFGSNFNVVYTKSLTKFKKN